MNREEAIKIIKSAKHFAYDDVYTKAFDMAIKALEPCSDAISRQAVDNLSRDLVHVTRDKADFLCNFWEGLRKLPSVNPQEPKEGHWVDRDVYDADRWKCSECGRTEQYKENFCPNCGARMEGEGI